MKSVETGNYIIVKYIAFFCKEFISFIAFYPQIFRDIFNAKHGELKFFAAHSNIITDTKKKWYLLHTCMSLQAAHFSQISTLLFYDNNGGCGSAACSGGKACSNTVFIVKSNIIITITCSSPPFHGLKQADSINPQIRNINKPVNTLFFIVFPLLQIANSLNGVFKTAF